MMTSKERHNRLDSLSGHWWALHTASSKYFDEYVAISHYGYETELPKSILRHVWAAEKARWNKSKECFYLRLKIDGVAETMRARPFLHEIGNGASIKCAGWLPNLKATSTDEATALKMYAAYKAAKASERCEDEKLPF